MDIEVGKRYMGSLGTFEKFWCGAQVEVLKVTSRTVLVRTIYSGEERKFTVKEFSECFRAFNPGEYSEESMRYRVYRVWPRNFVRSLKGDLLLCLNATAKEYLDKSKLVEELDKTYNAK